MHHFNTISARLRWGCLAVPAAMLAGTGALKAPNVDFAAQGRKRSAGQAKSVDFSESIQRIPSFAIRRAGSVAGRSLGETT